MSQTEHKNIYMCVKEGINNAIKYADASQVVIKLWTSSDHKLYVNVTDNGQGFEVQSALQMGGNCLRNIISRMT